MLILLADDEKLVRLGLKNMLEEIYPDEHIYLEVSNGIELLGLLKLQTPDIIFLDIHMPQLNGLNAFEKFNTQNIAVIILTGYAEFKYVTKALSLGAVEYLLKPASLKDIHQTTEKAILYCQNNYKNNLNTYQLECSKIFDLYQNTKTIESSHVVIPPFSMVLFYVDISDKILYKKIADLIFSHCHQLQTKLKCMASTFFLNSGEICFLCSINLLHSDVISLLESCQSAKDCIVTAFLTYPESLSEVFSDIELIQSLSSLRICTNYNYLFTKDILLDSKYFLPLSQKLECVSIAYQANDILSYKQYLSDLKKDETTKNLFTKVNVNCTKNHFTKITRQTIDISSYDSLIENLITIGLSKMSKSKSTTNDIIRKINVFVSTNYMNQIGINTLSELFNISPNYLSKIYKSTTGENFIDYLTHIRVENAKKILMEDPNITIKSVAMQVGYFSTRYFTKVFLKHTNMLPSAFQKMYFN